MCTSRSSWSRPSVPGSLVFMTRSSQLILEQSFSLCKILWQWWVSLCSQQTYWQMQSSSGYLLTTIKNLFLEKSWTQMLVIYGVYLRELLWSHKFWSLHGRLHSLKSKTRGGVLLLFDTHQCKLQCKVWVDCVAAQKFSCPHWKEFKWWQICAKGKDQLTLLQLHGRG